MHAILAEAGTANPYACFALGAVIFDEGDANQLDAACASHMSGELLAWDDAEVAGDEVRRWIDAVREFLSVMRAVGAEFRVIVCRKEDYVLWNHDPTEGFAQAVELLEGDLRVGAVRRPRRTRPLITDAHFRQDVGVASAGYLRHASTDVRADDGLASAQATFALFVSAVASDTDSALRPPPARSRAVEDACLEIASFIDVEALRNDTWPTYEQSVGGPARHNIWHFPSGFRSSPGVSEAIEITV